MSNSRHLPVTHAGAIGHARGQGPPWEVLASARGLGGLGEPRPSGLGADQDQDQDVERQRDPAVGKTEQAEDDVDDRQDRDQPQGRGRTGQRDASQPEVDQAHDHGQDRVDDQVERRDRVGLAGDVGQGRVVPEG